jgi:hypothetical protein
MAHLAHLVPALPAAADPRVDKRARRTGTTMAREPDPVTLTGAPAGRGQQQIIVPDLRDL